MNKVADLYFIYQFIKRIVTPFEKWDAFKLGIIDKNGKVLKKKAKLKTPEEKSAWGDIDIVTTNLKKLLAKVPGGSSVIGSAAASYLLMKEGNDIDPEDESLLEERLMYYIKLVEDGEMVVPANSVGAGQVAALGVSNPIIPNQAEPGGKKSKIVKNLLKRKNLNV